MRVGAIEWEVPNLEAAANFSPGTGRALISALQAAGSFEVTGRGTWRVTPAGRTITAARATAKRALAGSLERVVRVNDDPYLPSRVFVNETLGLKGCVNAAG